VDGILARDRGRWVVEGGGILATVDEARFDGSLGEGRAVTFGVRPHDFELSEPGAAVATLNVEIVEALGSEAFAYGRLRSGGPRIVARLEVAEAKRVKPGEALPLGVAPGMVHLFDPPTGRALDAR
jgi:ABC-type sugar transport system ATPase subunit